jgi:hypothetical protein
MVSNYRATPPAKDGQLYCRKGAKNFGQSAFLSACELEHGRFRALFAVGFGLRCCQHSALSSQQSALSQNRKPIPHRPWSSAIGLKPTPIWDHWDAQGGGVPHGTRLSPETNPKTHRQECRCHTDPSGDRRNRRHRA